MTKVLDMNPEVTQIVVRSDSLITPASLEKEAEVRKLIKRYIADNLQKGTDFYELEFGGRKTKPSLSKPGSEKFMSLFHLRAEFTKDEDTWNMAGSKSGLLCYVCKLYAKGGQLVGEGRGARDMQKDGGDANKALKMAQKSAQIDAVLRTGALSDFFTQDIEDMKDELPTIQLEDEKNLGRQIMALLVRLNRVPENASREDVEKAVKLTTDLSLSKANYKEILSRLKTLNSGE